MKTENLPRDRFSMLRCFCVAASVALLVSCAFSTGGYLERHERGVTPAQTRRLLTTAEPPATRQMLHRLYEDAQATIATYRAQAKMDGWRGDEARAYLDRLRQQLKD